MMQFGMSHDSRIIDWAAWIIHIGKRDVGFLEKMTFGKKGFQSCSKAADLNLHWFLVGQPMRNCFVLKTVVVRNGMKIPHCVQNSIL